MRKLFCWMLLGLSAAGAWAAPEATVRQVFRPERLEAGATNIKVVQPIDEAAWIWMKGEDVWGAEALAADAWADPPPPPCSRFYRFRRAFVSDGTPLALDVSADERFVLLLDGRREARPVVGPRRLQRRQPGQVRCRRSRAARPGGSSTTGPTRATRSRASRRGNTSSKPSAGSSATTRRSRSSPGAAGSSSRRAARTTRS